MHQTPWRPHTCFLLRTAAGWLGCSHRDLAISGFYDWTDLQNKAQSISFNHNISKSIQSVLKGRRRKKTEATHTNRTFSMNSVVVDVRPTHIRSKMRTCDQKAPLGSNQRHKENHFLIELLSKAVYVCIWQEPTSAYKWVKNKVVVFDHCMVGHDEWQGGVHAGVPDEMSVLHTVEANQFSLAVCNLKQKYKKPTTTELNARM